MFSGGTDEEYWLKIFIFIFLKNKKRAQYVSY